MNTLGTTYQRLKSSIVAIADVSEFNERLVLGSLGSFPPILGTGVMIDKRGAVLTNRHVAELMKAKAEARAPEPSIYKAYSFLHEDGNCGFLGMTIREARPLIGGQGNFVKPAPQLLPDLAVLLLTNHDVPIMEVDPEPVLYEGMEVAYSGFPLGQHLLAERMEGNIVQLGPTLRTGRIAAIQPYPHPTGIHGFLIDAIGQRGFSGSPVFSPETGDLIGLVYAGVSDSTGGPHGLTYAIPSTVVAAVLAGGLLDNFEPGPDSYVEKTEQGKKDAEAHPFDPRFLQSDGDEAEDEGGPGDG